MSHVFHLEEPSALESALQIFTPQTVKSKTPWIHPGLAGAQMTGREGADGYVIGILVYLDTLDPRHDGRTTHRRARFNVKTSQFFCMIHGVELKNVAGFMLLNEGGA